MGGYLKGGTSVAINLRGTTGARIVFISPPTEEKRLPQASRDVVKQAVQPAINPASYMGP